MRLRRRRSIAVLVLILAAGLGAPGAALSEERNQDGHTLAEHDLPKDYLERLQAALERFYADPADADRRLSDAIADPNFARLPKPGQNQVLAAAAATAWSLQQYPRALDLMQRAIAADPGIPEHWYWQSQLQAVLKRYEASADSMRHIVETAPDQLDTLDDAHLFQLVYLMDRGSQQRLDLLQALYDANWQRQGRGVSQLWYELAAMRIERGQADAALQAIRRIDTPAELVKLRIDRRFDAIVDRESTRFDIRNAADERVRRLQTLAALAPRSLELRSDLASAYLEAGQPEQALALIDAATEAIAKAPVDAAPFDDMDEQRWLMNYRAIALRRLKRVDEALSELRRASELDEDGGANISQTLNLAGFYLGMGRPDQALAAAARAGSHMSGYGKMVQTSVSLHAAVLQRDAATAERALEYLKANRGDGQIMYLEALIGAGRKDEAAQVLIELLQSPTDRIDALLALQDFELPPLLPTERAWHERGLEIRARKDVQDAVSKVGRIESQPMFR